MQHIEVTRLLANSLEHGYMQRIRVADRAIQTQCLRPTRLQFGRCLRIAACEQNDVMSKPDQFVGQPRNNTLGASVELRRNGLSQRGYLRDQRRLLRAVTGAADWAGPLILDDVDFLVAFSTKQRRPSG